PVQPDSAGRTADVAITALGSPGKAAAGRGAGATPSRRVAALELSTDRGRRAIAAAGCTDGCLGPALDPGRDHPGRSRPGIHDVGDASTGGAARHPTLAAGGDAVSVTRRAGRQALLVAGAGSGVGGSL